jgi:hypothetical protein
MNPINLNPTNNTPEVIFSDDQLTIKGRSIPMNELKFYEPVILRARELKTKKLNVEINIEYMNSGSTKKILELLRTLDTNPEILKLKIHWFYEEGDEEMLEHGRILERFMRKADYRFVKFRDAD